MSDIGHKHGVTFSALGTDVEGAILSNNTSTHRNWFSQTFMAHLGYVSVVGFLGLLIAFIERLWPRFGRCPKPTESLARVRALEGSGTGEVIDTVAKI